MNTIIVGYTGFVGSNLCATTKFDKYYNSKNIAEAFGTNPDLLIYSGVPAEMYIANKYPEKDLSIIQNAIENIRLIGAKRVVLISSIAVYPHPVDVDEDSYIDKSQSTAYGRNRRILEEWVEQNCPDSLIIRLPGIFGINIKKNFIYDMINIIPSMLAEKKYYELAKQTPLINCYYILQDNGFAKCVATDPSAKTELKSFFEKYGFTALNFTDSRGLFQYFDLSYLWNVIQKALEHHISILNVAVEPVYIAEIYEYVYNGKVFKNELNKPIPNYNIKSKYAQLFNGSDGYLFNKQHSLENIKILISQKSAQ